MAGPGYITDRAVVIEARRHWNGSGPEAFGGVNEWPGIHARIDLPATVSEYRRDRFVSELAAFIAEKLGLDASTIRTETKR